MRILAYGTVVAFTLEHVILPEPLRLEQVILTYQLCSTGDSYLPDPRERVNTTFL